MKIERATHQKVDTRARIAREVGFNLVHLQNKIIVDAGTNPLGEINESFEKDRGVVFVTRHIGNADTLEALKKVIWNTPEGRKRREGAPMSEGHYKKAIDDAANVFGLEVFKVATPHSIENAIKRGEEHSLRGAGRYNYLRGAARILSGGGGLFVTPEGRRRKILQPYHEQLVTTSIEPPEEKLVKFRPIGLLLSWLNYEGIKNVDFSFVDFRVIPQKIGPIETSTLDLSFGHEYYLAAKYETRLKKLISLEDINELCCGDYNNVDRNVIYPIMVATSKIGTKNRK